MRFSRLVPHRLGMRVRFVPYDFASKPPPFVLEGECDAPRQADQILGLEAVRSRGGGARSLRGRDSFDQARDTACFRT